MNKGDDEKIFYLIKIVLRKFTKPLHSKRKSVKRVFNGLWH